MWNFFWVFLAMILAGAAVFGAGVAYGMFMMSVALSNDIEIEDDPDEGWDSR